MPAIDYSNVIDKLGRATTFLILTSPQASGDDLASALALKDFLTRLEKEVVVVSPASINQKYAFLPGFSEIRDKLNVTKSFVIDISTKRAEIEELSYKKDPDKLSVFIKPKTGQFSSEDVAFRSSNFPFDLIICVGISSLESLGEFYSKNAELFFETPVINIDRSFLNDNFAQSNLVDLSATANSEIVYDLINNFEASLLDERIATALLTGMIVETNSFQHTRTTPAVFLKASKLVGLGANQQEIINKLYKNKSLGFLKLWGRVLARLKQEPALSVVYSVVNRLDLEKSGATEEEIDSVIKEMALQLSFAKTFFFLVDGEDAVECYGITAMAINLQQLFINYHPSILGQAVKFKISGSAALAEGEIIAKLKEAVS